MSLKETFADLVFNENQIGQGGNYLENNTFHLRYKWEY